MTNYLYRLYFRKHPNDYALLMELLNCQTLDIGKEYEYIMLYRH